MNKIGERVEDAHTELFSDMQEPQPKLRILDQRCSSTIEAWSDAWFVINVFVLILGALANGALLWQFVMERKSLSASKVLGLNLAVMDLIFLCTVPLSFIPMEPLVARNHSNISRTHPLENHANFCSILNLMGCPLLLTCMCVERYLAAMRPVLYLRVRKREYRVAVSVAVWTITLVFVVATILVPDEAIILAPISIIMSCLFVVMLACLGSVMWSLQQQSPALAAHGNKGSAESGRKRQALRNVLIVVVPAVISYFPVLVLSPMLLTAFYVNNSFDLRLCEIIELLYLFPRLGLFIGPLFYFSKASHLCCLKGTHNK